MGELVIFIMMRIVIHVRDEIITPFALFSYSSFSFHKCNPPLRRICSIHFLPCMLKKLTFCHQKILIVNLSISNLDIHAEFQYSSSAQN